MPNDITIQVSTEDDTAAGVKSAEGSVKSFTKTVKESGSETRKAGREAGEGFDHARESADELDTKAMGFRDTLTGVQDTMGGTAMIARGDLFQGFFTLGAGIGDLASGMANFLIPAVKAAASGMLKQAVATSRAKVAMVASKASTLAVSAATKAWTAAQWLLNAALSANPIGLVIVAVVALVAAIVLAYKHSATFRRIVQAAGKAAAAAFQWVLSKVSELLGWIRSHWPLLLAILTGPIGLAVRYIVQHWDQIRQRAAALVSSIRSILSRVTSAITRPFSAAYTWVTSILDRIVGYIRSVPGRVGGALKNLVPSGLRSLIGMATGGIAGAASGGARSGWTRVGEHGAELVKLPAGSHVYSNNATRRMDAGGGADGGVFTLRIESGGTRVDDFLVELLRRAIRARGGDVQEVMGT